MSNERTQFLGGKIIYRSMMVIAGIILLLIVGCQPEEKKQSATIQAIDTLQKDQSVKKSSAAREVFPGGDNIQQSCEFIQEQAEILVEEYHQGKHTDARMKQILTELKKLEQEWKQADCQQVFGYMVPPIPAPTDTKSVK